ncbi:MAG: hypothetical protein K1V95_06705 [Eubacterium sp.]
MAKKNKNKNIINAIIFIVLLIIAVVVFLSARGYFGNKEETKPQVSVSDSVSNSNSNTAGNNETTAENSTSEPVSESHSAASGSDDGDYNPALPLTIEDAFDLLKQKYGNDSRINMSSASGKQHNFTVIKNGELYATVKVNLSTGEAEETISATDKVSTFRLV